MNRLCILLFAFTAIAIACHRSGSDNEETEIPPRPEGNKVIVGGMTAVSDEDMNEPLFKEAVNAAINEVNAANPCHNFELVKVRDASQQVVAGMKYRMSLIVKPVFSGEESEECQRICATGPIGEKVVHAEVVSQAWKNQKHSVQFVGTPGMATDFSGTGEMFLECEPTIGPLLGGWSNMSPENLKDKAFKDAVDHSIADLNEKADRCFRYELDRVVEGRQQVVAGMNYEWMMKVHRIYDESLPDCEGRCADECTGVDTYRAKAYVVPWQSPKPKELTVKLAN